MQKTNSYPLDNSAIIHLAALRKNHTNSFRIKASMKEYVCAETLQKALNNITFRFPTIIAGIHKGFWNYKIVPVKNPPLIIKDENCLAPTTKAEIKKCAFRVLYRENSISAEFFHSMTDGYGGMVVINTLIAEYLRLKLNAIIPHTEMVLDTKANSTDGEKIDDYFTYAGDKKGRLEVKKSYQLPNEKVDEYKVLTSTQFYPIDKVQNVAHHYNVSITTVLSAVMIESVNEIRNRHLSDKYCNKPIQIMIPVNLRNIFPSQSLRNFSLFGLIYSESKDIKQNFNDLLHNIQSQLSEQTSREYMSAKMATHTKAECFPLYRILPLPVKWLILHIAHILFGESNSCISLSNLGVISLPEEMKEYVETMDFILSPRIKSPYNCGIVSFDGILSISFSRRCAMPELETVFFDRLESLLKSI